MPACQPHRIAIADALDKALMTSRSTGSNASMNNDCFRFLDLPKELRLNIYGHLYNDWERTMHVLVTDKVFNCTSTEPGRDLYSPTVLRVCRQIYTEAHDAVYRGVTVRINLQSDWMESYDGAVCLGSFEACHFLRRAGKVDIVVRVDENEYTVTTSFAFRCMEMLLQGRYFTSLKVVIVDYGSYNTHGDLQEQSLIHAFARIECKGKVEVGLNEPYHSIRGWTTIRES